MSARTRILCTVIFLSWWAPDSLAQDQAEIESGRDNTLFESDEGAISNGAGSHLFAGRTAQGLLRRTLVWFDVAEAIPEGALVTSVSLHMNMSRTIDSGERSFSLHRVLADWGEGTSAATGEEGQGSDAAEDDATWIHRFHPDEEWEAAGGDFESEASGTLDVGDEGSYTWVSSEKLAADVQHWLDNPDENFGWILLGGEDVNITARRFDSRHHPDEVNRPRLTVEYSLATASDKVAADTPRSIELYQNYPNPFNPSTRFVYRLHEPGHVTLSVLDLAGREISTLVDEVQAAGEYRVTWNTQATGRSDIASGVYAYRLQFGESTRIRYMVIVR